MSHKNITALEFLSDPEYYFEMAEESVVVVRGYAALLPWDHYVKYAEAVGMNPGSAENRNYDVGIIYHSQELIDMRNSEVRLLH